VAQSPDYLGLNLTGYIAKQTFLEFYHKLRNRNVSTKQVAVVTNYLDEHSQLCGDERKAIQDSIAPKRKNVIFIIVESLNAWAVNRSYSGHEVTPTLNALIKGQGTVSALNMVTQVLTGVSSDGQFIYNTGMLPSSEVTTVYYYDNNKYISLANKFKDKYSFEMICESASAWNHYSTTKAYSYDNLICDIEYKDMTIGNDGKLFKKAIEVIDTIQKPFFAELTTISMHGPFKEPYIKRPQWINQQTNLTESMRNYLTVTNYFDTQLKSFIDALKQCGKYDDTMIFIASDHSVIVEGATDEENSQSKIVFMALNTGINAQIEQAVGQVDVYPTILDLMGEYDPSTWTGLGLSMFNPNCNGAIDKYGKVHGNNIDTEYLKHLKSAQAVTNTMLRMDYFASHNNKYL
jgi:phosphoglycerol transferase MdoB-like AlkP superfamily enzyme